MEEWHPPTAEPPMPTGPESFPATGPNALAKLGRRASARSLDALLVGIPAFAVLLFAYAVTGTDPSATDEIYPVWWRALWFVMAVGYETIAVAWKGQTLGKLALHIKVARLDNGRRLLWWQAANRIAFPAIFLVVPSPITPVFFLGIYASSMFDPMGRGYHDKAAGSVVVTTR